MEEVAHRVDEDQPWRAPLARLIDQLGMDCQFESVAILGDGHGLQPLRHPFGVAELAAGTDEVATGDGVPSGLSPFYVGGYSDDSASFLFVRAAPKSINCCRSSTHVG